MLKSKRAISQVPAAGEDDHPFMCSLCGASFALRKHLGAHQAKSHGIWNPARHYALDVYCHSCHRWIRWFGSVRQVQAHLKRSDGCLSGLAHLFQPLTKDQVRQVEAQEVASKVDGRRTVLSRALRSSLAPLHLRPLKESAASTFTQKHCRCQAFRPIGRPLRRSTGLLSISRDGPRRVVA